MQSNKYNFFLSLIMSLKRLVRKGYIKGVRFHRANFWRTALASKFEQSGLKARLLKPISKEILRNLKFLGKGVSSAVMHKFLSKMTVVSDKEFRKILSDTSYNGFQEFGTGRIFLPESAFNSPKDVRINLGHEFVHYLGGNEVAAYAVIGREEALKTGAYRDYLDPKFSELKDPYPRVWKIPKYLFMNNLSGFFEERYQYFWDLGLHSAAISAALYKKHGREVSNLFLRLLVKKNPAKWDSVLRIRAQAIARAARR